MTGAERVVAAWTDEGRYPPFHRQAQQFLRERWPALAGAIEALVEEDETRP